ncbi:hypothetical protein O0L34_g50 [Tuta absoluta]|nr:hypothetical protein O0L34_g50 [Tuta absoluta]
MRPGDKLRPATPPQHPQHPQHPHRQRGDTQPSTPDGYVEMNYGRAPTRPIAIAAPAPLAARAAPSVVASSPDERRKRNGRNDRTPLGSQTIFPLSLDSPASPADLDPADVFEDDHEILETPHHPLTTVREISEDGRKSPEVSSSPSYVKLAYCKPAPANKSPDADFNKTAAVEKAETCTAVATVVLAGSGTTAARFSVSDEPTTPTALTNQASSTTPPLALNYASLDLEPARAAAAAPHRTYTQIDFARSEKLAADSN